MGDDITSKQVLLQDKLNEIEASIKVTADPTNTYWRGFEKALHWTIDMKPRPKDLDARLEYDNDELMDALRLLVRDNNEDMGEKVTLTIGFIDGLNWYRTCEVYK